MTTAPAAGSAPAAAGAEPAGAVFAAVDIGASSGRVILGRVSENAGGRRCVVGDGAPVSERCGAVRRRAPLGLRRARSLKSSPGSRRAAAAVAGAASGSRASASTPGPWTTAWSTARASSSRSRTVTGMTAAGPPSPGSMNAGSGPAVWHHGSAVPAVQHHLPARQRAGPARRPGAAHPGPDRLPADRQAPDGGDECLHHRALRRRGGGVGHRVPQRPGPAQGPVPAADPARRNHRHAAAGHRRADRSARPDHGGRGGVARHRLGCGRRPRGNGEFRLYLLGHVVAGGGRTPAPGPHGGQPAWRISPTNAASTAPSATCATSAGSGSSANASGPGRRKAWPSPWPNCWTTRRGCRPADP